MRNNNVLKSLLAGFLTIICVYLISFLLAKIINLSLKNILFIAGIITAFIGAFPFIKGSGGFYQWAPSFMASQINAEEVANSKNKYGYSSSYRKTVISRLNITALVIFIGGILILLSSFIV